MKRFIIISLFVIALLPACKNSYQKILKSSDTNLKYQRAMEYYNKKDYARAMTLFESLLPYYKGTQKGEEVLYYYTYCNYNMGDYITAGYYFRKFTSSYPASKHTDECFFMSGYCYYLDSPKPELDQENTKKAIDEFQLFMSKFPKSERVGECNKLIDGLRAKLAKKEYLSCKLYYNMGYYKATDVAIRSCLKTYPDSPFREELTFMLIKSNYSYAVNSIETKMVERFKICMKEYSNLAKQFPQSKYLKEGKKLSEQAGNELKKLNML